MNGETQHYKFFQNRACEYYPCHEGVDGADFNCLFCYCPLYTLGKKCGGSFTYNEKGNKVCTNCSFPHRRENYGKIIARYKEIMEMVRLSDERGESKWEAERQ